MANLAAKSTWTGDVKSTIVCKEKKLEEKVSVNRKNFHAKNRTAKKTWKRTLANEHRAGVDRVFSCSYAGIELIRHLWCDWIVVWWLLSRQMNLSEDRFLRETFCKKLKSVPPLCDSWVDMKLQLQLHSYPWVFDSTRWKDEGSGQGRRIEHTL